MMATPASTSAPLAASPSSTLQPTRWPTHPYVSINAGSRRARSSSSGGGSSENSAYRSLVTESVSSSSSSSNSDTSRRSTRLFAAAAARPYSRLPYLSSDDEDEDDEEEEEGVDSERQKTVDQQVAGPSRLSAQSKRTPARNKRVTANAAQVYTAEPSPPPVDPSEAAPDPTSGPTHSTTPVPTPDGVELAKLKRRSRKGVTGPRHVPQRGRGRGRGLGKWGELLSEREKRRLEERDKQEDMQENGGNTTINTAAHATNRPKPRRIHMVGRGIVNKPPPAPAVTPPVMTAEVSDEGVRATATVSEEQESMAVVEVAVSGGVPPTNGPVNAIGDKDKAKKRGKQQNGADGRGNAADDEGSEGGPIDHESHTRKKRKVGELDPNAAPASPAARPAATNKAPRGKRPPPINSGTTDQREPPTPGSALGTALASPVVTGFPIHAADKETLDSLRSAQKIRDQQRQLITARLKGEAPNLPSPGLGPPPSAGLQLPADAPSTAAPTRSSASSVSVGQRRGEVARNKVAGLRLNTTEQPDPGHRALMSAPAAQTSPVLVNIIDFDNPDDSGPVDDEKSRQSTRPDGHQESQQAPVAHRSSIQGYAGQPLAPAVNGTRRLSTSTAYYTQQPGSHSGAMTAYPALGGNQPPYSQQQQLPPLHARGSAVPYQPPTTPNRRNSGHQASASLGMPPPHGSMPPPSMSPFVAPVSMMPVQRGPQLASHARQYGQHHGGGGGGGIGGGMLSAHPGSYAPGDPTPMQARFGPGRSPPSSTIRRDFAPNAREWQATAPQTAMDAINSHHDHAFGVHSHPSRRQESSDPRRVAFMEPFHLFYDALMDSTQLRTELAAKMSKANELVDAQEVELGRIRELRGEYEMALADLKAGRDVEGLHVNGTDISRTGTAIVRAAAASELESLRKRVRDLERRASASEAADDAGRMDVAMS